MNHLAHLYFADDNDESIVGNLLPDFVRGSTRRIAATYGPAVMRGVMTHRFVDAFTDAHPAVAASKQRLDPALGLLRGVIVDVFYDHLLARRWPLHHDEPLADFTARCCDALLRRRSALPPRLRHIAPLWRHHDTLASYAEFGGVTFALDRIADRLFERTGRRFDFAPAAQTLRARRDVFEADFVQFFPSLVAAAERRARTPAAPADLHPRL